MYRNIEQEYQQTVWRVASMPSDYTATQLAGRYGQSIYSVTWYTSHGKKADSNREDNARYKNSSWGPCISDMTLCVEGRNLPVIRPPNYQDLTWDVEIENIPLVVGNERG